MPAGRIPGDCSRGTAVLELRACSKCFGGVTALDAVSVTLNPGDSVALIGPNGSGKTTLINVASGFILPDRGGLIVGGIRMEGSAPHRYAHAGVARTFQEGRIWMEMSVLENVLLPMRAARGAWFGKRKADAGEASAALDAMKEVGLTPSVAERLAGELSLMDRRRVELARVLLLRPIVLLIDEITAGLNPVESRELFSLLQRLRGTRPQMAVIAIEHKLDLLLEYMHRMLFMESGRILLDASAHRINAEPALLSRYWDPIRARRKEAS